MFMTNPELSPEQENSVDEHPWARRIKDTYFNKIKYAHNSIRNPEYPKKEEKVPSHVNQIQFTVIGDRITKEFIYCARLVAGLHKYRKIIFKAPVIRGITTVEWPKVLEDLKVQYGGMVYCLQSSVAVIINNKFLGGEKELKNLVESKFQYNLSLDYYKESIAEFAKFIRGSGRPFVYMKISIDSKEVGNLIFMLYDDILPYTCANFLRLCNETKGGYSGTPIHRIVKDGWIQGGGFGLKETSLACENFVIPHDRRGVLGMANSGLHMECSTQFFVLLQPAPWMARKFVAFGQLVEGKNTLEKIEAVPTWYESPTSEIIIYKAGIFNMDCQDIMINKGANEYIDKHIEDLNELGEVFYDRLLENVFLTAQLKELERLKKEQEGEGGAPPSPEEGASGVRETKRFNRRKEDIERQIQTSKGERSNRPSTTVSRATSPAVQRLPSTSADKSENNDFDVESYDPEYEGTDYQHQSLHTPSVVVKPKKPFYIPLTDVLYPGEKDSNFDLKRFLQGDYCLESDLKEPTKKFLPHETLQYASDLFELEEEESEEVDSSEDKEMRKYLKNNVDRISFAGGVVRNIGKGLGKLNIFDEKRKSELITDDRLRRLRMVTIDQKTRDQYEKKVSISLPSERPTHIQIKRRQTGFVRPEDLEKIRKFTTLDDDDEDDDDDDNGDQEKDIGDQDEENEGIRKVRIDAESPGVVQPKMKRRATAFVRPTTNFDDEDDDYDDKKGDEDDGVDYNQRVRISESTSEPQSHMKRRVTAFVRAPAIDDDDDDDDDGKNASDDDMPNIRQSVLVRLFEDVTGSEEPPTLKDYRPMAETHPKNLLTFSSNYRIKSETETNREQQRYIRQSITAENDSYEHVLNLQHGKKVARKISSDYVKTIDQIEHKIDNSIRSVEFAKTRPAMSVAEYQEKNRKYQEQHRISQPRISKRRGLRLPGDTPLHSEEDMREKEKEKERRQSVKEKPKAHKGYRRDQRHLSKA